LVFDGGVVEDSKASIVDVVDIGPPAEEEADSVGFPGFGGEE
jgi:hypothetical protein